MTQKMRLESSHMQITQKQLDAHLSQSLSSLYLISGDVPLLVQETRENVVNAAQSRGFSDKEIYHVDSGFQIDAVIKSIKNIGLFEQKKIIDIRNQSAKFDAEFVALLTEYCAQPTDDRLIIISTDKLSSAQQKSNWLELIKKSGVYVPIWSIAMDALLQWIMVRARKLTLTMSPDSAKLLATFTEGNLLATQQTLEKCQSLHPNSEITRDLLITVLSDHAHFSVFDLSDAMARHDTKKIMRILLQLEQSGEEPVLVLWSICRKIRENMTASKNTARCKRALQFAASVDEIIKGAKSGDAWQALLQLCLM